MIKTYVLLTAIGSDRPGLVERITKYIVDAAGNVEESRMARLGGEFAALLLISVPSEQADALCRSVKELCRESLTIVTKATSRSLEWLEGYVPYSLEITGADHEGIIHEVSRFLAEKGINIAEMETGVDDGPTTGTPIFSMLATIQVPPDLPGDLEQSLSVLGTRLATTITLKRLPLFSE